ncbi:MAG TPA: histidinol-phosphatase [bacterium]|nr:histidinol-phosphatase [bacterium]
MKYSNENSIHSSTAREALRRAFRFIGGIRWVLVIGSGLILSAAGAQTRRNFRIPDIPGYLTLKGDFHMHTPFSDGTVWPTDRVLEAWRDGLDIIAITDHVEYRPNQADVSTDLNRPWQMALPEAEKYGILLIHAAEITRSMPPGHFNAYFLQDANLLQQKEIDAAFEAAAAQGAFFIWNHPGWKAQQPDTTRWFPVHTEYLEKGWLHGIEIFNEKEYYPVVQAWADEKNLTVFANSDVHGPIDFLYDPAQNERRPMTLVFAEDRSLSSVREAFEYRRTAAFFNDTLAGPEEWIKPLVEQCLSVQRHTVQIDERRRVHLILTNHSDMAFNLQGISTDEFKLPGTVFLRPNSSERVVMNVIGRVESGENTLRAGFRVLNALTGPGIPLIVEFTVHAFLWPEPAIASAGRDQ